MGKNSTITRLPLELQAEGTVVPDNERKKDEALLALIKKGGTSAKSLDEEEPIPEKRISLRMSADVAERIKQAAKSRPVKVSSHSWLLEAVFEKLKKESF
jgi:hypothetical protein